KLPHLVPVSLADFENGDAPLLAIKDTRSTIEYYFTCTPSLLLHVLNNNPEVDVISYVDADLFFFSDPAPIYEELGRNSILIIEHRFPPALKYLEAPNGIYNVGLLSFRNDEAGRLTLNWWRERCIEKCSDTADQGHFADQKYLDDWPQ